MTRPSSVVLDMLHHGYEPTAEELAAVRTAAALAAADALAEDVRRFVHPRNIPDTLAAYWAARRGE